LTALILCFIPEICFLGHDAGRPLYGAKYCGGEEEVI
jgi:hypothetical protein